MLHDVVSVKQDHRVTEFSHFTDTDPHTDGFRRTTKTLLSERRAF